MPRHVRGTALCRCLTCQVPAAELSPCGSGPPSRRRCTTCLELRAERQAEGIAAARRRQAEGRMLPGRKHIGRPKVTGPAEIATLRRLIADGASVTQAARTLKISRSTAYAALATTR